MTTPPPDTITGFLAVRRRSAASAREVGPPRKT